MVGQICSLYLFIISTKMFIKHVEHYTKKNWDKECFNLESLIRILLSYSVVLLYVCMYVWIRSAGLFTFWTCIMLFSSFSVFFIPAKSHILFRHKVKFIIFLCVCVVHMPCSVTEMACSWHVSRRTAPHPERWMETEAYPHAQGFYL